LISKDNILKNERLKILFEQKALGDAIISRRYMIHKFGLGNYSVICNDYNQQIFNGDVIKILGLPLRKDQRKFKNILEIIINYKNSWKIKADIYLFASSFIEYLFCLLYFPCSRTHLIFLHDFENFKLFKHQINIYSKINNNYNPTISKLNDLKPKKEYINIVIDAGKKEKEIIQDDILFLKKKYKEVRIYSFKKYSDYKYGYSIINNSIKFAEEFLLEDNADILFMDSYYSHFFSQYFPNIFFYVYFRTGYPEIWCPIGAIGLLSKNFIRDDRKS
jgi:hypothetical protein